MTFGNINIPGNIVTVEGEIKSADIFLFTLSTCQWCKKAKNWFINNKFQFKYLDVDFLTLSERRELKKALRHTFNTLIRYPFAVINGAAYVGYVPDEWKVALEHFIPKPKKEKNTKDVLEYVQRVAKIRGWKLNPNIDGTFDLLIEGLKTNFNRYGYYNCPCRESNNNKQLDRDIICPCDYAEQDIKEYGHCYCALYFDQNFDFEKQEVKMIPERRREEEQG